MRNISLIRLMIPVVTVSFILLTVGIVAAWHAHHSQRDASTAVASSVTSIRAAEELAIGIRDIRTELHLYLITKRSDHIDSVGSMRRETDRWLAETERTAVAPRGAELVGRVKRGYDRFFLKFGRIQSPSGALAVEAPGQIGELAKILEIEILQPAQDYLDFTEEEIARRTSDQQQLADRTALGLLLLGVCGPVSGLLAGYGIARQVNRSIVRLSVAISDTAGKLDGVVGPINFSPKGGLDALEIALRAIAERVGSVVERLHQSQREALRSKQLATLGQLAAGFAHELRNALMPMKILVQAAVARSPTPVLEGPDLAVLDQEITRLERSVQALLDFARPGLPSKQIFDPRTVVKESVALVTGRARRLGVTIEHQMPERAITVRADLGQFRQVIFNLLLNALDAVREGGRVHIALLDSVRPIPSDAGAVITNWVALRVEDDGCGLPADLGSQIFEPFISTKETGVGLGLSICKRIIDDHGGEITAANREEGGAVFTVFLPGLETNGNCIESTAIARK